MEVGFRSALIIQRAQDAPQRKYSRVAGGGGGGGGARKPVRTVRTFYAHDLFLFNAPFHRHDAQVHVLHSEDIPRFREARRVELIRQMRHFQFLQ